MASSSNTGDSNCDYCIAFDDVLDAAARISDTVHRTPVLTSSTIMMKGREQEGEAIRCYDDGKNFFFKCEALQKTGSFKFRGALNAIRSKVQELEKEEAGNEVSNLQVVTHSSGNHAQAIALASKLSSSAQVNVQATIVMPNNAPTVKKAAVQSYGATIVEVEPTNEARQAESNRIVQNDPNSVFIHPSENPYVIAGQGTVCYEFIDQLREMQVHTLDVVIIPVGGGGLASGNITYLRGLFGRQRIKIVLAEPEVLDDAKRSFESQTLLKHDPANKLQSVADGLKTTLGPNTWPIIRDLVDDIMAVSEREILRCTKLVWERLKVMIEPSAGVGVAVAQSREFNQKYPKSQGYNNVGIILCGGNVDIVETCTKMKQAGL
mmetsp:Transcript_47788/g.116314  ORF Transcript_47788/g.116314 Transcript_47788/m.116314 type:complete len:378 (+) Transcript_47788:129-1262(+)